MVLPTPQSLMRQYLHYACFMSALRNERLKEISLSRRVPARAQRTVRLKSDGSAERGVRREKHPVRPYREEVTRGWNILHNDELHDLRSEVLME